MNWLKSSIDSKTIFDCPYCGKSLIPKQVVCEHVIFFFIDAPNDAASYYYGTDEFSSYIYLEIANNKELANEWLEENTEDMVIRAKAGQLGYQYLPGICPSKELLLKYCNLNPMVTVHEFIAEQSIYSGQVIIALDSTGR